MRQNISTTSPYEPLIGFSRAVRIGNTVAVSGTVGWQADGTLAEGPYNQAKQALTTIEWALEQVGATLSDVIRTRVFVTDMANLEAVGKAHKDVLGDIMPASTTVAVALGRPEMLVEIEADAIIER